MFCCWWFQSKLFTLQQKFRNSNVSQSNFCTLSIPLITKPTRVTSKTVSLIDNIFTNFIFDTSLKLKKGINKSDVSDHFPVFASLCSPWKIHKEHQEITIYKRVIHDTNLMVFKTDFSNVYWNSINHSLETNSKYETF